MELLKYIIYINTFVWFLVPIRQYQTRFFIFFLILGLFDPIFIASNFLFKINISIMYLLGTSILLYTALFNLIMKTRLILSVFFFVLSLLFFYFSAEKSILLQLIMHLLIFFNFFKMFVLSYSESRKVSIFLLILLSYEFSLMLKFFMYLTQFQKGMIYFHLTSAFQILMGLFFIFVNEKNSPAIKV